MTLNFVKLKVNSLFLAIITLVGAYAVAELSWFLIHQPEAPEYIKK